MGKLLYAIRKGRNTGIFETQEECHEHTFGYHRAEVRGFKDFHEAFMWLLGADYDMHKDRNEVYAIRRGRWIGVTTSYDQLKISIEDYKGAEYRKFGSKDEANAWLSGKHVDGAAAAHAHGASASGSGYSGKPNAYAHAHGAQAQM